MFKKVLQCVLVGENKLLLAEISGFMALRWEALWWRSSISISPVPSGILMNYSELDGVQVRGTAGYVSVMIKCCSAATSVSWTTRHLPAQTGGEYTAVFIWCFCGWSVQYMHKGVLLNCCETPLPLFQSVPQCLFCRKNICTWTWITLVFYTLRVHIKHCHFRAIQSNTRHFNCRGIFSLCTHPIHTPKCTLLPVCWNSTFLNVETLRFFKSSFLF